MVQTIAAGPGRLLAFIGRNGAYTALAGVIIGLCLPSFGLQLKSWLAPATAVAVFGAFLSASYSVEKSWIQPHVALVMAWTIAAPALLLGTGSSLIGTETGLLTGIVLCSVAPPSAAVPSFAALLRLSPKLALITYAIVSAAAPFAMPALASLFGVKLDIELLEFGLRLFYIVGGGGICAFIAIRLLPYLRWLFPDQAAAGGVSALGLMIIYIASSAVVRNQFDTAGGDIFKLMGLAICLYVLMVLAGTLIFIRLGSQDALTAGLLTSTRNVTMAWAAAAAYIPAGAEAYIAATSLLNGLMPFTFQRTTALVSRLRRGPRIEPVELSWHELAKPEITISASLEAGRKYRIGRGIDSDILMPDKTVSRIHAELEITATGEVIITDLGSTNGLMHNGEREAVVHLEKADEVRIGIYVLRIGRPRPVVLTAEWYDTGNPEEVQSRGLAVGATCRIGRSYEAEIHLHDRTVSGMHAELSVGPDGEATIKDLGSTNGLTYRGERVEELKLADGDMVDIGAYRFRVKKIDAAERPSQALTMPVRPKAN